MIIHIACAVTSSQTTPHVVAILLNKLIQSVGQNMVINIDPHFDIALPARLFLTERFVYSNEISVNSLCFNILEVTFTATQSNICFLFSMHIIFKRLNPNKAGL